MKIISFLMLVALVAPLSGCGQDDDQGESTKRSDPRPTHVEIEQPRLVATWSEAEARDQTAWLRDHREPRILEGAAIDAFLADLPSAFDQQEIDSIDQGATALLVAGFSECDNSGSASIRGNIVTYTVRKAGRAQCVWAPIRVQVFAVASGVTLAG